MIDADAYEAGDEAIEERQEAEEHHLAEFILALLLAWSASIKVDDIATALDDTDANHVRRQLAIILNLNSEGIPESVAAAMSPAISRLQTYATSTATRGAAMAGYDLAANHADIAALRQSANSFLALFMRDTGTALASAIEAAIYAPGDTVGRAIQLQRSIGLSVLQSDALERMRDVLQQYLETPRELVRAHIDASGRRVAAHYVRRVNVAALLEQTRGHLSAAQRKLLARAISNPRLTDAEASALLARHADALRKFRTTAAMRRGLHELTETAKLTGWRVAQAAGVLPADQRRFWHTAGDERVRLSHAAVPTLNPHGVPLNEPFNTPLGKRMSPPLEWNCRCRISLRQSL